MKRFTAREGWADPGLSWKEYGDSDDDFPPRTGGQRTTGATQRRRPRAKVIELLPRTTFTFDGRIGTIESIPYRIFDSRRYSRGVLSVIAHAASNIATAARLRVRIDDAVQVADEPQLIFSTTSLASVQVLSTTPIPSLQQEPWTVIGPGGRLRVEWQQAGTAQTVAASVTVSIWMTLRP